MVQNIVDSRRCDASSSVIGHCPYVTLIMLLLMILLKIIAYWVLSAHSSSYHKRYDKTGAVTVPLPDFFLFLLILNYLSLRLAC